MEEIKRDRYLKQLIDSQQNGFIKVISYPHPTGTMSFKANLSQRFAWTESYTKQ